MRDTSNPPREGRLLQRHLVEGVGPLCEEEGPVRLGGADHAVGQGELDRRVVELLHVGTAAVGSLHLGDLQCV